MNFRCYGYDYSCVDPRGSYVPNVRSIEAAYISHAKAFGKFGIIVPLAPQNPIYRTLLRHKLYMQDYRLL